MSHSPNIGPAILYICLYLSELKKTFRCEKINFFYLNPGNDDRCEMKDQRNIQIKENRLYFFLFRCSFRRIQFVSISRQLSSENCKSSMIFIRFHSELIIFTIIYLSKCTKMTSTNVVNFGEVFDWK